MNKKEPIPMFKVKSSKKVLEALKEVFDSGMIGEGTKVEELTYQLEGIFGCNNLLLLNSGTSALTLAGRLIGLKPGDEVITTPFTMIATNVAMMPFGVKLIWSDINSNNVNISIESIRKRITGNTKAIIVTLVGGVPCEMERLKEFNIPIIADCAHAIDTIYKGKHISAWADYSCFSFQSIKQFNTVDGGAIVIKDGKQFERAEKLKWFGMTRKVPEGMTRLEHQMTADVPEWGYKFHMNDILAAIGLCNLDGLGSVIKAHRYNVKYYMEHLKDIKGLMLPVVPEDSIPSWWSFYIFVDDRDKFIKKMEEKGIVTTPMWRRNDLYSTFKDMPTSTLENMDKLQDKIIFIPVGWWLKEKDLEYIVKSIKEVMNE